MGDEEAKTSLAVILSVGYDRLMADDAEATAAELERCQALLRRRIEARGGRVAHMADDETRARFASAVDALRTAVAVQADMKEGNAALPIHRQLCLRMGLDLAYTGDWEQGIALVEKARALNPFHPDWLFFPLPLDDYRKGDSSSGPM